MSKRISKVTVPNDPAYIAGLVSYCSEICAGIGFTPRDIREISTALNEACTNVITHAFDPDEDESFTVTFEILDDGLLILIDEMGFPFSFTVEEETKTAPGLHAIEENMDRVVFINRGKDGKELQLYKYLRGRHVREFFTEDELKPYGVSTGESVAINLSFRLMRPDEALEISRCIYRAYKYTYMKEELYFPERIEAMNRDGSMVSTVCVTDAGEVVGHFALMPNPNGRVAEIGVAVVVPKYRGRGIMKKLLEYIIDVARSRSLTALYGNAFTTHKLSQKTNLRYGFVETALQLGRMPPGSIHMMKERGLKGAGHLFTFFKYLSEPEDYRVHLPARHMEILLEIYRALGVRRTHAGPFDHKAGGLPEESVLELSIKPFHKTAVIYVKGYGKDLLKRVNAKLIELANRDFNAVYLDLLLSDPHTPEVTGRLEGLGCFFSGLLPDYADGDILRLQHYNTRVEYDEILTESRFAEDLKGYVKNLDTKWAALHSS